MGIDAKPSQTKQPGIKSHTTATRGAKSRRCKHERAKRRERELQPKRRQKNLHTEPNRKQHNTTQHSNETKALPDVLDEEGVVVRVILADLAGDRNTCTTTTTTTTHDFE